MVALGAHARRTGNAAKVAAAGLALALSGTMIMLARSDGAESDPIARPSASSPVLAEAAPTPAGTRLELGRPTSTGSAEPEPERAPGSGEVTATPAPRPTSAPPQAGPFASATPTVPFTPSPSPTPSEDRPRYTPRPTPPYHDDDDDRYGIVPSVVGYRVYEAASRLRRAGYGTSVVCQRRGYEGRVAAQQPPGGSRWDTGGRVALFVNC